MNKTKIFNAKLIISIIFLATIFSGYAITIMNKPKLTGDQIKGHVGIKIAHASTDGGPLACSDCHVTLPSLSCIGCHPNPDQTISSDEIKFPHHNTSFSGTTCGECHGSFTSIEKPSPRHSYCNDCHSGFSHSG